MQPNLLANVPLQQLKQAVAIREKIESLEKELSRVIGGGSRPVAAAGPRRKRRGMSAAARAKISAAAKARWAKVRAKKAKK